MTEDWKSIDNWETYKVSNHGRVFSCKSSKIMKICVSQHGYEYVNLSRVIKGTLKQRRFYIHRIVALHFLWPPIGVMDVNHKDGNKRNNNIANLEFVTRGENIRHAVRLGLRTYKKGSESFIMRFYHSKNPDYKNINRVYPKGQDSNIQKYYNEKRVVG